MAVGSPLLTASVREINFMKRFFMLSVPWTITPLRYEMTSGTPDPAPGA